MLRSLAQRYRASLLLQFTGTALCVITPVVYRMAIVGSSAFEKHPAFNYASFMSGLPYVGSLVKVVIDKPLPWTTFFILAAVTAALISSAARITHSQDF